MSQVLKIKIAGISMLMVGIGHTFFHFLGQIKDNKDAALSQLMVETKAYFIIERSVMDYHIGFSLAMGLLLIGLGLQILSTRKYATKSLNSINMMVSLSALVCSIIYFHPVAMGLTGISFFFLLLASFQTFPQTK